MTPLPAALGGTELVAWRLDRHLHAASWDSGRGAYLAGGRWNSKGKAVVYCAVDPATAIIEVAAHVGFRSVDTVPHVLSALTVVDPAQVYVVNPSDVPNPYWLHPGIPSAGQQQFGDALLQAFPFVLIPSAVSPHSWNLIFDCVRAKGFYKLLTQEQFALDTRLHPPA